MTRDPGGAVRSRDRQETSAPDDLPAGIGAPARRALAGAGYTRLDQLAGASEAELLRLHGMGPKAMRVLREALAARGEALGVESGARRSTL